MVESDEVLIDKPKRLPHQNVVISSHGAVAKKFFPQRSSSQLITAPWGSLVLRVMFLGVLYGHTHVYAA